MRISVTLIARNSSDHIAETIKSLKTANLLGPRDELLVVDTGSTDNTVLIAERLGARVLKRPDLLEERMADVEAWLPEYATVCAANKQISDGVLRSFAEARNIATQAARHDIQFWIDTDDVIEEEKPGELRRVIDKKMPAHNLSTIFLDYHYAHDEVGNVSVILKRERVFDRRKYRWVGPCHEVLIPHDGIDAGGAGYFKDLRSVISHRKKKSSGVFCDLRNYLILRKAIEEAEGGGKFADTRFYYYLANACRGLKHFDDAIEYYKLTLKRSGSRDDCFQAAHTISLLYMIEGRSWPASAMYWAHEAMRIKPLDPRGYFLAQRAAYIMGNYKESIWWFVTGRQLPPPVAGAHLYEPKTVEITPWVIAGLSYKELGDRSAAMECIEHLAKEHPRHSDFIFLQEEITNWIAASKIGSSLLALSANMTSDEKKQFDIMRGFAKGLKAVPFDIEERGIGAVEPRIRRPDESLAIYCGKCYEPWGPKSVKCGHGGSERAVWEVSRRMAKRGFDVTVYNSARKPERGLDSEGVTWRHWSEFNQETKREAIIYWRVPGMLELPFKAREKIVWCHDVQNPREWTDERTSELSKVFVLSEYHKETLGGKVPDEKVIVTRNGIDREILRNALKTFSRRRGKVIFTSDPSRGALTAIEIFNIARMEHPDIELHIFYGFNKLFYERMNSAWAMDFPDVGRDMPAADYIRRFHDVVTSTKGVINHGRVSWGEMAKHFAEASIWLYPTRFPEISCISAMEAQAAGCSVITTDYAALRETVDWTSPLAHKISADDTEAAADELSRVLKEPPTTMERTLVSKQAMDRFDWDGVCDEWARILKKETKTCRAPVMAT